MGWRKRDFVTTALEEIGIASYVFDVETDRLQSVMRRLDAMMAEWNGKGLRLGYPIPIGPDDGDLDDETGVPDSANEAIFLNLAIRIAPSYGKTVMPETKAFAKMAYNTLLQRATMPPEMQMPAMMPAGAGHKTWRNNGTPFLPDPIDNLTAGSDSELTFD